jgi:hypothetical protein
MMSVVLHFHHSCRLVSRTQHLFQLIAFKIVSFRKRLVIAYGRASSPRKVRIFFMAAASI